MADTHEREQLRDALAYIYDPEDFYNPPFECVDDAWAVVNKWERGLDSLTADLALKERMVKVLCRRCKLLADRVVAKTRELGGNAPDGHTAAEWRTWAESRAQGGDGDE